MSILKGHSYDIFKLYLNQFGITVFSFILITAFGSISDAAALQVGISVFTTAFFSVLIYTVAWDLGAKDKLSIDAGKEKQCSGKGAILSLLANVPNFLLSGGAVVCFLLERATDVAAFESVGAVFLVITKFTMAIYLGIVENIVAFSTHWGSIDNVITGLAYFIVPVIAIAVTQLGYYFGLKEKKLFGGTAVTKKK